MTTLHYLPSQMLPGGYAPSSHGYWMPQYEVASVPSTIIPPLMATPMVSSVPMPSSYFQPPMAGVPGTPAWLPGTVSASFTPANGAYSIPLSAAPSNAGPTSAPATAYMSVPLPTASHVPTIVNSPISTPESLIVPLPTVESDDEEPAKIIMVEKREQKAPSIKSITRIECCGGCYIDCRCSLEDTGSPVVISCSCQLESFPTAAPSTHIHRHSYYPESIYDFRHRHVMQNVAPPPKEKERHRFFLHKSKKPLTPAQWADSAARHRPLNQVQVKHFYPEGVELHPLLNKASTSLFFNVLESREYITLADGESVASIETHHATSPPLLKLEIASWLHSAPIVLENSTGVTVGDIIDGILKCTTKIVPGREVREWSPERRGIIYRWYWHNRSRVHGMSHYLTVGDTFEGFTSFEGLSTSQQAKKEDRRASGLSHCTLVLSLGMDGCIPGLRPLGDFPY